MRILSRTLAVWGALAVLPAAAALAQAPVAYRVSFPAPEHRWMQVDVTFPDLPAGPLHVRMSRSSPGRYALHEFAKNVFDVEFKDGQGRTLTAAHPNLHQWDVTGHDGTVVLGYRVFGDRTDGTYLSVDATHGHLNMPAALMYAHGLEQRAARVQFEPPPGTTWSVATQLFPTGSPLVFTAPNLQYLMDSPAEVGAFTSRVFTVDDGTGPPQTFRIALHHDGTEAEADAFAADVERIVREAMPIYGALPRFDGGTYTFLCDYLPWANGDGMEHRNSTVLSSSGALRNPSQRANILGTVAHEFFHSWNMERIRSRAIEPFNFDDANMSGELWFGEGFTSYFDTLITHRSGLDPLPAALDSLAGFVNQVTLSPGRKIRTAEQMSQMAPFVDAAVSIDRTAWPNTFISYYTWGAAIGLGLDLSLRDMTNGKVGLDDYMRLMWSAYGVPGMKAAPGVVAKTYGMEDLQGRLAQLSGNAEFAREFFAKYVQGHDVPDYERLLARMGLLVRKRAAGKSWLGQVSLQNAGGGLRVGLVPFDSPLYNAGLAQDDQIVALAGIDVTSSQAVQAVLAQHAPGAKLPLKFVRRSGETVNGSVVLEEDPRIEIVPAESAG
ncbi:MAG TPA: PDZ domain-containing protein, partial [Vicinamibacterales bacterium]|nr:PDZ domain-containing protein [Vicinamibacterales bacterium]